MMKVALQSADGDEGGRSGGSEQATALDTEISRGLEDFGLMDLSATASFFAEARLVRSGAIVESDALELARVHWRANDVARAARVIERLVPEPGPAARLLAAQCYLRQRKYDQCLAMLSEESPSDELAAPHAVGAAICTVRAACYEQLENTLYAVKWYTSALRRDFRCVHALERVMSRALLPRSEAARLVQDLAENGAPDFLVRYYRCWVNAADPAETVFEEDMRALEAEFRPVDLRTLVHLRAVRLFSQRRYDECFRVTAKLVNSGAATDDTLVLHLSTMFHAREGDLFRAAHQLEAEHPQSPLSHLAIGYYYFKNGPAETAKRYLQRCTALDPLFVPGWTALGHVLSSPDCDDSDQALVAYRTASRLMPESPLPHLFAGMEHARVREELHADKYFSIARRLAPWDPAPIYEAGVLHYRAGFNGLDEAVKLFTEATRIVERSGKGDADLLEQCYVGLGHCLRRKHDFQGSERWSQRALSVNPASVAARTALGMAYHAQGELSEAISLYHQVLAVDRASSLMESLLDSALEEYAHVPP